jgi:GTPase
LVSDTVGFIERLPHTLVAAFRATLEAVAEADLILHVIDAADPERERHISAVLTVLDEVGASDVPVLDIFNKCDKIGAAERARLQAGDRAAICISALLGDGHHELLETVASRLALDTRRVHLEFDSRSEADRDRIARVYRHARVVSHVAIDHRVSIEADIPRRVLNRLEVSTSDA